MPEDPSPTAAEQGPQPARPPLPLRQALLPLARVAGLLALVVLGLIAWSIRSLPPLATDGLIYHLSIPAFWLQEGYLSRLDFPFHMGGVEDGPMLSQTINYLLLALTGQVALTKLLQPVCLAGALVFLYRSARLAGVSKPSAWALTGLAGLFPPFLASAQFLHNDLVVVFGAAVMLYGLLLTRPRPLAGMAWAVAGAAWMMLTKSVGVIYAAVGVLLLLPVAWRYLREAEPALRPRRAAQLAGLALALVAGAAFFWLNWARNGNPFYPGRLGLLGVQLPGLYDPGVLVDHGWAPSAIRALLVSGGELHSITTPWSLPLWLCWGATALLALRARREGRRVYWQRAAAGVVFPALSFLLLFSRVPFWSVPRYLLPLYYGLFLAAAAALGQTGGRSPWLSAGVPALLLAAFGARLVQLAPWEKEGLVAGVLLALAVAAALSLAPVAQREHAPKLAAGLTALALLSAPAWYPPERELGDMIRAAAYRQYYDPHGEAWVGIERIAAQREDGRVTVAYAGSPMTFPLFGPRLRNRVVYVPIHPDDRPTPIELEPRPPDVLGGYWLHQSLAQARRAQVDDGHWLAGLEREGVDLLFLAEDPYRGGSAQERAMIARHPERFRLLFQRDGVRLYARLR